LQTDRRRKEKKRSKEESKEEDSKERKQKDTVVVDCMWGRPRPEPELPLENTESAMSTLPVESNTRALVHHAHNSLVAPAALLRVVHTVLPLYAVLLRLAQFALWRRRA
jgi:hypothetical protein